MSCTSLHTCLASIASLNLQRSLNPMPPSTLGLHKVSYFFQCIFLWSPLSPHQNSRITTSMSLQRPTGKRKQFIANVGIACTTTLRRTSLLACDNNFSFHPWIFLHTLSLMKFRLALMFLTTTTGRPKYFSYSLISRTPRKFFMSFFVVTGTTLLKKRVVCWYVARKLSHIGLKFLGWLLYHLSGHDKIADYHQQKISGRFLDHISKRSIP